MPSTDVDRAAFDPYFSIAREGKLAETRVFFGGRV
jgi:hypothetical protein